MPQLLSAPLDRAQRLFGSRLATIDGDTQLTYAEVAARCRRLAGALHERGVRPGGRVAVLMANGHRYLELLLAVPAAGGVIVPLNNRHAAPEQRYILDDAGASLLVADEANAALAAELEPAVKALIMAPGGYDQLVAGGPDMQFADDVGEDSLAGLFYTGGTTGAAKGVMLSHRNLVANALHIIIALRYSDADRYLHCAPMFHLADGASTYAVTWTGGTHVFVPAFEPVAVMRAIEQHHVTNLLMVPAMLNALVNHPDIGSADLSSLRMILHGAAPISSELLRRSIGAFGCSFAQGYGMTETAPLLTVLEREEDIVDSPRLRSAGREVVGVDVTVRREDGSLCEAREVGEVVVRGPNIMLGYWNKDDATAEVLRDGWYWTRDVGYLDEEGYLFLVDRAKDMIISGGENVYSIEVEDAVMSHPAILDCAVIGVPDDHWGERVHAVVVLHPGASLDSEELVEFCKGRIAGYKCPRSMEIAAELPRSAAGKVLKRDLRDPHWAGHNRNIG